MRSLGHTKHIFSFMNYGELVSFFEPNRRKIRRKTRIFVVLTIDLYQTKLEKWIPFFTHFLNKRTTQTKRYVTGSSFNKFYFSFSLVFGLGVVCALIRYLWQLVEPTIAACGSTWVRRLHIYHFQWSKLDRLEFRIRNEGVVFHFDPKMPTRRPLQMYSYLKWICFTRGWPTLLIRKRVHYIKNPRATIWTVRCDRADGIKSAFPLSWCAFPFLAIDILLMRISCPQAPSHSEIADITKWPAPQYLMIHYGYNRYALSIPNVGLMWFVAMCTIAEACLVQVVRMFQLIEVSVCLCCPFIRMCSAGVFNSKRLPYFENWKKRKINLIVEYRN